MTIPIAEPCDFIDIENLPVVHFDDRRTISEKIDYIDDNIKRTTRIVVNASSAVLGNHYHEFQEEFTGMGGGKLYTATSKEPGDVDIQDLPNEGWKVIIAAGTVHAFYLPKKSILISVADKLFLDGINTHSLVIISQ